jgi:hypothetical protein
MNFNQPVMGCCKQLSLSTLSFHCHALRNLGLFTIAIVYIACNCTFCIQLKYSSHHSVIGYLNDSNTSSNCCLHSWHEETFVQLANKKNSSSHNILLIGIHVWKLKLSLIHSRMLSLFPPLVRWHRVGYKPYTNMNIFRISILFDVCHICFAFYILQIVAPTILASSLLCAHGNGGKTLCRSGTPQKMWYIGCHLEVICCMQGAAMASQSWASWLLQYHFISWA